MAVLHMEGFTGIPRATSNFVAGNALESLGWIVNGRYSGTNPVVADGNVVSTIEADPVFATRNQLSLNKTNPTAVSNYIKQIVKPLDTSGFEKFVIGGMFMVTTADTTANSNYFCIGDQTLWPSSSGSFPLANIFVQFAVPNNGADGIIYRGTGEVVGTTPLLKKGKWTHFELLLEQDVDRIRGYLDGTLVYDVTWTGTFASVNGGVGFTDLRLNPTTGPDQTKISNVYVLGLDALHTGRLGAGARVLEVVPSADLAVQFSRPSSYASNAAVLAQMFNSTTADYLTAGDPATDLYTGIDAVAANAAQVYGAMVKVNAMSMADGIHTIAAAAKSGATNWVASKTYPLTLGIIKPIGMDVSRNPATNALWTPAEIAAAGIGFRLIQ